MPSHLAILSAHSCVALNNLSAQSQMSRPLEIGDDVDLMTTQNALAPARCWRVKFYC
jgi:hypothetical protein